MAEDFSQPDAARFKHEEYDVTCCCEVICCGGTRLVLGEEEAEMSKNACCGICKSTKRGPYGELGTVDSVQTCCFYGFRAASLMTEAGEGESVQCTGCGCEQARVLEIVANLKKRQEMRGDRAKVRLAETTLESIQQLHTKVDMIWELMTGNLNSSPVVVQAMDREEDTKKVAVVAEQAMDHEEDAKRKKKSKKQGKSSHQTSPDSSSKDPHHQHHHHHHHRESTKATGGHAVASDQNE